MGMNRRGFLKLFGGGAAAAGLGVLKVTGDEVRADVVRADSSPGASASADAGGDMPGLPKNFTWLNKYCWVGLMYCGEEIRANTYERQPVRFELTDDGAANKRDATFKTFAEFIRVDGLGLFDSEVGGKLLHIARLSGRGKSIGPGDTAKVAAGDLEVVFSI